MGALSPKLGAGKLDRRIKIVEYEALRDETGAPLNRYCLKVEVWANVHYKSAKETDLVTKETSVTNVVFTIRHRKDLDTKMLINYDRKVYNILGITEKRGRDNYLELLCEQVENVSGEVSASDQVINEETGDHFLNEETGESIIIG